ncbi:CPBP family glutamic-type intramembrane protease [Nesterenkonia lutea]|uniref:Membrane protease YdiL (CAAX protease family) n=1 Tax=Nesterenkonia lutea TaxID=272919 RepID=A0ABR9JC79_9MICC|nr:type II CAAX endopeptidase family protein [Nesterenkonia lutea]MBE1523535.1 membrane protease YdiL (CAAX protease family) [Nesterenkonia lutea]
MRTELLSSPARPAALLVTWTCLLALFAGIAPAAQAVLNVPFDLVSLVMFAPALACVAALLRPDWLPAAWESVDWLKVLRSTALACIAVVGFVGTLALLLGRWPSWPPGPAAAPLVVFLVLQTAGVLAEEIGWRGLVQRCGERFAKPVVVSVIAGFIFGATHLGYWSLGLLPVLTFAVTAMLMSVTITTIYVGSLWQRMVPAVTVHLGVNLGLGALALQDEPLATAPASLAAAAIMLAITLSTRAFIRQHPMETVKVHRG